MIQIIFKRLEKSELARDAVLGRFEAVLDNFPDLKESRITVTLSMENSPIRLGPTFLR